MPGPERARPQAAGRPGQVRWWLPAARGELTPGSHGDDAASSRNCPQTPTAVTLAGLLDALPDGVVALDDGWRIIYVNPAGAALLQRPVDRLTGRSLWAAVPELAGTILRGFLLHARAAADPVTWTGFNPPADRWLTVSAVDVDGLLQVSLRVATPGGRAAGADAQDGTDGDPDRLRFLAEVSESLITTLDTGETATRLAELVTGRLCDWAVVALADESGDVGERAWAHHDPDMRADLDAYMTGRLPDTGDDAALVDALLTGQPVRVPIVHHEVVAPSLPSDAVRQAWRRLNTTSCAVVPLRARDTTFGALALLDSGDRPRSHLLAASVDRPGRPATH